MLKKIIILFFLIAVCINSYGTDIFISEDGDDVNDGLTISTPIKTIGRLNAHPSAVSGVVIHNTGITRGKFNLKNVSNVTFEGGEIRGSSDIAELGNWESTTQPNLYILNTTNSILTPKSIFFDSKYLGITDGGLGDDYYWKYGKDIDNVVLDEDFESFDSGNWTTNTGTVSTSVSYYGSKSYEMKNQKLRKNDIAEEVFNISYWFYLSSNSTDSSGNKVQLINVINNADWSNTIRVTGTTSGSYFYMGLTFSNSYDTTCLISKDTWYYINLIIDVSNQEVRLLINGELVDSLSGIGIYNNVDDYELGSINFQASNYDTFIDEFRYGNDFIERVYSPEESLWVYSMTDPSTQMMEAIFYTDDCVSIYGNESNYTFNNVKFSESGRHGVNAYNCKGDIEIKDCTFTLNTRHGFIHAGNSKSDISYNNNIINNYTEKNGEIGLAFGPYVQDSTIASNRCFYDAQTDANDTAAIRTVPGTADGGLGFEWWENKRNSIIDNFVFGVGKNATGTDVGSDLCNGIHLDTAIDSIVSNNKVYNSKGAGVYLECSSNTISIGNFVSDCEYGIRMDSNKIFPMGSFGNVIEQNSVINCDVGTLLAGKNDITFTSIANNYFRNNYINGSTIEFYLRYDADNGENIYKYNTFGEEETGFIKIDTTLYNTYSSVESAYGSSIGSDLFIPIMNN